MSQIFFKKVDVVNATNTFLDQLVSLLKEPARKLHAGYGLSARDALVWRQSGTGVMIEKAAHRVSFAAAKWEQTVRDNVQMLMLEVACVRLTSTELMQMHLQKALCAPCTVVA